MADNVVITKATGLNTQPNELALPPGSLAVAENVEITRDDIIEVSRGFEDFSMNLPDFTPEQLISVGGVLYLHLDNGLWYYDGSWVRKRGSFGVKTTSPGVAYYYSGHFYYASNNCIFDLDVSTGNVSTFAGRYQTSGSADGTGDGARFSGPTGITGVGGVYLYATDYLNHTIRRITISSGAVTTIAGSAGFSGSTDATGSAARFNSPRGITMDQSGNLYVCDGSNCTIRKIVISTGVVTTLAGTAGASGSTDGTGAAARFAAPTGAAIYGANLFVSDLSNHTIRKIDPSSGVVTTLAGSAGASGLTDGTGSGARFFNPNGLSISDGVNLYVCDSFNCTIRKIVISTGVVTTFAGSPGNIGSSDGVGTSAKFNVPVAIATDAYSLYICDNSNNTIRKIYSNGYVTTISGVPGVSAATPPPRFFDGLVVGPS